MKEHASIYKYISRHLGGFPKAIGRWYPGLYEKISYRRSKSPSLNEQEELSKKLINRFNAGLCISSSFLTHSADEKERELRRRVLDFAQKDLFGKKENYTQVVHRLTGLPLQDVKMNSGASKNCANLTEDFTSFLFYWSSILGLKTWDFDNDAWISHTGNAVRFFHGDKRYESDLRIGNQPIEVKNALGRFDEGRLEEVIRKYGNDKGEWQTGESMERGAIVFHADPRLYKHCVKPITDTGLRVITYTNFHNHLIKVISEMKKRNALYRKVRPLTNLDYLIDLHEEVSLHPFLLIREGLSTRREWSEHMLKALIDKSQEIRNKHRLTTL